MSTVEIEPVATQMLLPFALPASTSAACETPARESPTRVSAARAATTTPVRPLCQQIDRVAHRPVEGEGRDAQPTLRTGTPGNQPVRLGSLMIRLLKSYGVTDAEIADGLEAYALKQQASLAS